MITISPASAFKTMTDDLGLRSPLRALRAAGLAFVLLGSLLPKNVIAAEPSTIESQYNHHLTCAVYYRMVAGSFKRSGKGILAAPALDRMTFMTEKAKALSATLGNDEADYLSDWSETLNLLTGQINHNYKNIRQLKTRYKNRCEVLGT